MKTIHLTNNQLDRLVMMASDALQDEEDRLARLKEKRQSFIDATNKQVTDLLIESQYKMVQDAADLYDFLVNQQDGE